LPDESKRVNPSVRPPYTCARIRLGKSRNPAAIHALPIPLGRLFALAAWLDQEWVLASNNRANC
jgi:hypothetical protein